MIVKKKVHLLKVKHYSDDGYTGSNFNRPGFEELKRDIALKSFLSKKQINTIYFHLDNNEVGIGSTRKMIEILSKDYYCFNFKPIDFKDVNDELKNKSALKTE